MTAMRMRIDLKPSTATLSKGQAWLQNTDKLLSDVKQR